MNVLIVNTSEKTGGAAVAAHRLMDALNNNGVKARMLVRDKETDDIRVGETPHNWMKQWHFLWERLVIYLHLHFSKKRLFEIDIANTGADITKTEEFREADVVHLHWINQGMLSTGTIRRILDSEKPVVWTMHDMWPATSICHYTRGCDSYRTACCECQLLPHGGSNDDLSAWTWRRKRKMLAGRHVNFVACSRWLEAEARKSRLLKGHGITSIPNPIDNHLFRPMDKKVAKRANGLPEEKRIILFVSQRVTDKRKGMDHFVRAINTMVEKHPEAKDTICIAILGGHAEDVVGQLPLPSYPLGYVGDQERIISIYNSADTFVLPSLEDNLPNTIMEAMACGVPCVGYKVGGIPEMIDHRKNGYLATLRDATDLSNGIWWVLEEADYKGLADSCVGKVARKYSQHSVAIKYIEVYNEAIAYKRVIR